LGGRDKEGGEGEGEEGGEEGGGGRRGGRERGKGERGEDTMLQTNCLGMWLCHQLSLGMVEVMALRRG